MQPITVALPAPSEIADVLGKLAEATEHDRDLYRVLVVARDQARLISWNRWKHQIEHRLRSGHMRRRHQRNIRRPLWADLTGTEGGA